MPFATLARFDCLNSRSAQDVDRFSNAFIQWHVQFESVRAKPIVFRSLLYNGAAGALFNSVSEALYELVVATDLASFLDKVKVSPLSLEFIDGHAASPFMTSGSQLSIAATSARLSPKASCVLASLNSFSSSLRFSPTFSFAKRSI